MSFGAVADLYDRLRSPYPDALIEEIAARQPASVLDIGCGTGKSALPFMKPGVLVIGIEPDVKMAEIALSRGVTVEVATFEGWDPRGRGFDLITCGEAWHWIDPVAGVDKIAQLLTPGGIFARFWNYHHLDDNIAAALDEVHRVHSPEVMGPDQATLNRANADPFCDRDEFYPVDAVDYTWTREVSVDEWVQLSSTYSAYRRLGEPRLRNLQQLMRETLAPFGPTMKILGGTYVRLVRRKQ